MRQLIYPGLLLLVTLCTAFPLITVGAGESSNKNHKLDLYESLYSAIEMDRANEVKQFIDFGAEINHRYGGGKTPLMLASQMGSISVVRVLLEMGADPSLVSEDNLTAMDYANNKNDVFIVAVLNTTQNPSLSETPTAELIDVETDESLTEIQPPKKVTEVKSSYKPEVTKVYKPQVAALPRTIETKKPIEEEIKKIGKLRNITGTYKAKTTAKFSECGIYNKTIEYLAEENINKQLKNGKFIISYTSPLLECKGKGKLSADSNTLKGKYSCSYSTDNGFKGSLRMNFKGAVKNNEIHMNYSGHDTSPGVSCNYHWDRVLVVNH